MRRESDGRLLDRWRHVIPASRPLKIRFFEKVNKKGPKHPALKTRCWIFTGSGGKQGTYGWICIGRGKGIAQAHRVAYRNMIGPIPEGMDVCHRCDNPSCVNPEHLFLGDQRTNTLDAKRKGRLATGRKNGRYTHPESNASGERNGSAKLTTADVLRMRRLYRIPGMTQQVLADEFNTSLANVGSILTGRSWRHIDIETRRFSRRGRPGTSSDQSKIRRKYV